MNIIHGDSLDKLKELDDNSVDSIVTDPPYGLSFMGKRWDYDVPSQEIWEECLRVLKPGGYLLAFSGTRTQHRMAVRIEDAGFEIRDMIAWVYGSGFPKSLNIGKAVDKIQGNKREDLGYKKLNPRDKKVYAPKSESAFTAGQKGKGIEAQKLTKGSSPYEGWGTALKPSLEPITVARKPISEKTVAENVLKYGTGGINIDGCRVEAQTGDKFGGGGLASKNAIFQGESKTPYQKGTGFRDDTAQGRFPANLIHDGSDEVVGLFPNTKGEIGRAGRKTGGNYEASSYKVGVVTKTGIKDSGSASRFFYCAKASKFERNKGCEELEFQTKIFRPGNGLGGQQIPAIKQNHHPTVKPISLMQYLVRLVTPKGGTVLDPFMGSGTTGIGAKLEGFDFIGIEREAEYIKIAEARINAWEKEKQKKLV